MDDDTVAGMGMAWSRAMLKPVHALEDPYPVPVVQQARSRALSWTIAFTYPSSHAVDGVAQRGSPQSVDVAIGYPDRDVSKCRLPFESQTAALGIAETSITGNEHECGLELLYPDDTPVSIPSATSSTPASRAQEYVIIEKDDPELNLVYPEGSAETLRASSSTPQTRSVRQTTFCDLFRDGLQTMPTLPDPAALVDKHPPMPVCDDVLSSQTNMKSYVTCSINDWRGREVSSVDALDSAGHTSSLTPDTSVGEKDVGIMLNEMTNVECDTPPTSSSCRTSGDERTGDHDVFSIPGWESDLTELSADSDTERTSDSELEVHETTDLRIRIPLLFTRLPPDSLLRKCGSRKCNIAVPKDHRWKTCDSCRGAQRMYQKMRFENMQRGISNLETQNRRWRSLSPEIHETDTTLTSETSRPCSVKHCHRRIPLPEVYRWKMCVRCRAKARRDARRKRDALPLSQDTPSGPEVVPRFPAYQNREALLTSFGAQLKGFVEGQIMYFGAKLRDYEDGVHGNEAWNPENAQMIFLFVGEYSIVTGQRENTRNGGDRSTSDDPMCREVSNVVLELESVLRTKFSAGEAFSIDKQGIMIRFTCSLKLIAQLWPLEKTVRPSLASGSDASIPPIRRTVPLVKSLSSELETEVIPDESHPLFHGQRIVVRYRMTG